jgi:hypothetical protein
VLGVNTKPHVNFDGFVEFGELDLLKKGDCLIEGVFARFYLFARSLILFAWFFCHISSWCKRSRGLLKRATYTRKPPIELFGVRQNGNTHAKVRASEVDERV